MAKRKSKIEFTLKLPLPLLQKVTELAALAGLTESDVVALIMAREIMILRNASPSTPAPTEKP